MQALFLISGCCFSLPSPVAQPWKLLYNEGSKLRKARLKDGKEVYD